MSNTATKNEDRERSLAVALSRTPLEGALLQRAQSLGDSGTNWTSVMDSAARLQVEPVVLGNLRSFFAEHATPDILAEAARREQLARANALSQTLRVMDVYDGLRSARIPALVLKGPAVAISAYGDPSRRTFSDIDLIIRRDDLRAAQRHLEDRGYRPLFSAGSVASLIAGQHALEFEGPGPHVELHWALLPRHLKFDVQPKELWSEAVTIRSADIEMNALAPPHLFLYLCAHGAKHEWMLYRWICDVAQLLRRLTEPDAAEVTVLARRTHTKRIVALALQLVRETFGDEPSPFLSSSFGGENDTAKLVKVAMFSFGPSSSPSASILSPALSRLHPYAEPLAFWMASRERIADRISCAARFLFEPTPGDSPAGGFRAVLRPARLAVNAVRRVLSRPSGK